MALSVNWSTGLITCPISDLTLISGSRYQITVDYLWQLLRDRSDDEDALAYPILYTNTPPTASTPRIVEINSDYYTFQFENGNYSVDIINGNTNLRDVEVKNNVSIGTNNTTGFINPKFLELSLFDGAISVDILYGVPLTSTGYTPDGGLIGTRQTPVSNVSDASIIAEARGIKQFHIVRSMTLGAGVSVQGYLFHADSPLTTTLTIDTTADVTFCEFRDLTIQGVLDGGNVLRQCLILNIAYFNGFLQECGLQGTVTLGGSTQATIWNCFSNVAGGGSGQTPTVDFNGYGNSLAVRDYHGGIQLINYSGGGSVSVDMSSGRVVVDNTLTGGSIFIRGVCTVEGTSGGTTINTAGILSGSSIASSVWNEPTSGHNTAGTTGKALIDAGSAGNPWSANLVDNTSPGTFGWLVQRLLTVTKFMGITQ